MKGLEGKKLGKSESSPHALTVYELCKTFHCLPSELDKEDNKVIEEMLVIINAIAEHEEKGSKKQRRNQAKEKFGKGGTPRG